jgi:hypothetical protein
MSKSEARTDVTVVDATDGTLRFQPPLFLIGLTLVLSGLALYFLAIALSIVRLALQMGPEARAWNEALIWYSGMPSTLGVVLMGLDLSLLLPAKRRASKRRTLEPLTSRDVVVALTAYNDEASIADAVHDFAGHPAVRHVIVVDNNSRDGTFSAAQRAGAHVVTELNPGYGRCVYRCLSEALQTGEALVVLCEGDMTFRARDIDKLLAYADHAHIVNGTRIVEQLRDYSTQLSTFMYYGNFFVGKLLEAKHLGRGTFTDVGTTYKLIRRDCLVRLMPALKPQVNLEFNAHFMDTALSLGERLVECPITFHPRVGVSKGGNVNNLRALAVGTRMIAGLLSNWR